MPPGLEIVMNIYIDAKEIRRGLFLIGYCDELFDGAYTTIRVNGSASAEREALEFAYRVFGDGVTYYSDFRCNEGIYGCIWISRNMNICDVYLRINARNRAAQGRALKCLIRAYGARGVIQVGAGVQRRPCLMSERRFYMIRT